MNITFYGAAHDVTGSNSLVEAAGEKFLVDCGMFQGSDFDEGKNGSPLPYVPTDIRGVFITHAHLDHVGRLPLLIKNGYTGFIYATAPTMELTELTLRDAASIMYFDHQKFGRPILYTEEDVAVTMTQFKKVEYNEPFTISSVIPTSQEESLSQSNGQRSLGGVDPAGDDSNVMSVTVTFHDAGHIFGSSFIEFNAEGKKVVFSGDVGNVNVPILRDTEALPPNIDALICESTYGDRLHESTAERQKIIEEMISAAISRGGVLMIPSFSIERTQELIYELNDLIDHKHKLGHVPIYLDSPMAIDALEVFRKYPEYYDDNAEKLLKSGDDLFDFPNLIKTHSREDSMKINHTPGSKIIIAGAGMMNGGRILHHAIRYLSDEHSTLLIIGYQAKGTLGRQLQEGHKEVMVLGERVPVRCQIQTIGALSAHGDQNKLTSWISAAKPKHVYLNHGEPEVKQKLAQKLTVEFHVDATPVEEGMNIKI